MEQNNLKSQRSARNRPMRTLTLFYRPESTSLDSACERLTSPKKDTRARPLLSRPKTAAPLRGNLRGAQNGPRLSPRLPSPQIGRIPNFNFHTPSLKSYVVQYSFVGQCRFMVPNLNCLSGAGRKIREEPCACPKVVELPTFRERRRCCWSRIEFVGVLLVAAVGTLLLKCQA